MAWFILLMFLTGWWINWIKTYTAIYSLSFYTFFFFFNSLLVSSLGCNKGKIDLAFWILYIGYGHIKHLSGHWRECRNWNQEIWVKFWISHLYSNHGQPERAKKSLLYCPKLGHLPDAWAQNRLQGHCRSAPLSSLPPSLCSPPATYEQVLLTGLLHLILTLPLFSNFIATTFPGNHYIESQPSNLSPCCPPHIVHARHSPILKCKSGGDFPDCCRAFPLPL